LYSQPVKVETPLLLLLQLVRATADRRMINNLLLLNFFIIFCLITM